MVLALLRLDIEHIFEERQIDQTTTRKHGGTGLGLAITKLSTHDARKIRLKANSVKVRHFVLSCPAILESRELPVSLHSASLYEEQHPFVLCCFN